MFGTSDDLIYLFGDSITQHGWNTEQGGWVARLSDKYMRRMTVVNAGLSGYSSDQALAILPRILPTPDQARIKIFVVFFGANDARLANTGEADSPDQHVPVDKFKENIRRIVLHPQVAAHYPKIVIVTPPPINEHQLVRKNRTAFQTAQYARAAVELVDECAISGLDIRCLNIWKTFITACGWQHGNRLLGDVRTPEDPATGLCTLLSDGLHLQAAGNRLLAASLAEMIASTWPEYDADRMPFSLPRWLDDEAWREVLLERAD